MHKYIENGLLREVVVLRRLQAPDTGWQFLSWQEQVRLQFTPYWPGGHVILQLEWREDRKKHLSC